MAGRPAPIASPTPPAATSAPSASSTPVAAPATPDAALTPPPTKPAPAASPSAASVDWLGAGDFDGDGRLDLAAVDAAQGTLSLYGGSGHGWDGPADALSTVWRRSIAGRPVAYAVGDLDADGTSDLLVGVGGAPDEQGLLLLWGRRGASAEAPWTAKRVALRGAPLAVLMSADAGHNTAYIMLADGFQTLSFGSDGQARLLPFVSASVKTDGTQAGAALLRSGDGAPAICYVGEPAGGVGASVSTFQPAAPGPEGVLNLQTLTTVPRALLADPAGDGLLVWEGDVVRMGRPGTEGGKPAWAWDGALRLQQPASALWLARLGPQQTPALLALDHERTSLFRYPLPAGPETAPKPTRYEASGAMLALAAGDADGDGRDDLVLAIKGSAGELRFETWMAASYDW